MHAGCVWLTLMAGACGLADDGERVNDAVKHRGAPYLFREAYRHARTTRSVPDELARQLVGTPSSVLTEVLGSQCERNVQHGYESWSYGAGRGYYLSFKIVAGRVEACDVWQYQSKLVGAEFRW